MTIIQTATHQTGNTSVRQEFRTLIHQRRQKAKQRQQSMLARLSAEINN